MKYRFDEFEDDDIWQRRIQILLLLWALWNIDNEEYLREGVLTE